LVFLNLDSEGFQLVQLEDDSSVFYSHALSSNTADADDPPPLPPPLSDVSRVTMDLVSSNNTLATCLFKVCVYNLLTLQSLVNKNLVSQINLIVPCRFRRADSKTDFNFFFSITSELVFIQVISFHRFCNLL